jgi:hypothetical protein
LLNSMSSAGHGLPLSPRQERIARWLLTQVGPGPAAFFRDACELMAEGQRRRTVTHLVGMRCGRWRARFDRCWNREMPGQSLATTGIG